MARPEPPNVPPLHVQGFAVDVRTSSSADLPGLSTAFFRAFHPGNAYMQRVIPDTDATRQWFRSIFSKMIESPDYRLYTAHLSMPHTESRVVGYIALRYRRPGDGDGDGGGIFENEPLTSDHDPTGCNAMLHPEGMDPDVLLGDVKQRRHVSVENFGVEKSYAGGGIGTLLLRRACEEADREGLEMVVGANEKASSFYKKVGFEERGRAVMPGEEKYTLCLLVRRAKGA